MRRVGAQHDIMETFKGWDARVDFDDHLVGHLKQFGRGTDRGTRHNPAFFRNRSGFHNHHVKLVVGLVLGVVTYTL